MLAKQTTTLIGTFTVWIENPSNPCLTFFSFIPELISNQQNEHGRKSKNKIPLCSKNRIS